jgi:hypothetical protein
MLILGEEGQMLAASKPRERKAAQEQAETEEEEDLDGKETNAVFLNGGIGVSQIMPNWTY